MSAVADEIRKATEGNVPSVAITMEARALSLIAHENGVDLGDGFHNLATAIGWKCQGKKTEKNGFLGAREARISETVLCREMGGKSPAALRNLKHRLWAKYGITFVSRKGYHGKVTVYSVPTLEQWEDLMMFNAACRDLWNHNPARHGDICQWLGLSNDDSKAPAYPGAKAFAAGASELDWHIENARKAGKSLNASLFSFESLAVKAGFITEGETVPRPVSFEFRHLAAKDSGEREGTRAKASVPSEAPDAYRVTGGREAPHPRSDYPAPQPNRGRDFTGVAMQEPWPGWGDSAYAANPF